MTGTRRRRLTNEEEHRFVEMWEAGLTYQEIATNLGLASADSIGAVRKRLGLPRRNGYADTAPPPETPIADVCKPPAMPPHPFWTPLRDLAVMATAGRYPEITALAAEIGRPMAAVLQRWHQLRAA